MPLINGQKMACEPCIRGHRSTKCTHAKERLMVPVRKPGRPLSSCPHPSSRPCSCASVTAAIPKKQKCSCAPSDTAASEVEKHNQDASTTTTSPSSPSKLNPSSFRVQKQGARIGLGRTRSVDLTGLRRMDSNQLNGLPTFNGTSSQQNGSTNGSSTPVSDFPLYGPGALTTPRDGSYGTEPAMFPIVPYALQPPVMSPTQVESISSRQNGISINGSTTPDAEKATSCCGGASRAKDVETAARIPDIKPNGTSLSKPSTKSCCSSAPPSSPSQEKKSAAEFMPPPIIPYPSPGVLVPPFQHPAAMPGGMYPLYAQPNIFTYPPQYGSYMHPLQPDQWRQMMAAMIFGQTAGNPSFGIPGPMAMQQQQNPTSPPETPWTSHQCNCGDSCQCVGCAAHPYNEATQNYVRSAWSTLTQDSSKRQEYTNGNGVHVNGSGPTNGINGLHGEDENLPSMASNGETTPNGPCKDESWSPAAAQTPSDAASGMSEEQALSANDFFFVSYPFGGSCAGDTTSCPCGDDCQCIGCAIHNEPELAQGTDEAQS